MNEKGFVNALQKAGLARILDRRLFGPGLVFWFDFFFIDIYIKADNVEQLSELIRIWSKYNPHSQKLWRMEQFQTYLPDVIIWETGGGGKTFSSWIQEHLPQLMEEKLGSQ